MGGRATGPLEPPASGTARWLGPAVVFVGVIGTAARSGAYFPPAWGWAALGLGWVGVLTLVLRGRIELGRPERVALAALGLLIGWIALGVAWSEDQPQTVLELERALVYGTGFTAVLLLSRRGAGKDLAGAAGTAVALVCAYSLATRLFPGTIEPFTPKEQIAGYRLSTPIDYWNGLGIFAALGLLVALGFAARARTRAGRGLGAAAAIVIVETLYFTFSRGGWIALGCGVAAALAIDARRLQLAATWALVAVPAAVGVTVSSRLAGLSHLRPTLEQATHDGRTLALVVCGLVPAAAAIAVGAKALEARLTLGRPARIAAGAAICTVIALAIAAAVVAVGGPGHVVHRISRALHSQPTHIRAGEAIQNRVFDLSAASRIHLWQAALHDFEGHPWLGSGAGSYEQYWLRHRDIADDARDAHELYLETLAELGPLGLALLLCLFVAPVAAALRSRRTPIVSSLLGAYVAYLLHAAVDWDWEVPAVTLTALWIASAILVVDRREATPPLGRAARVAVGAAVAGAAAFAAVGLLGNAPMSSASAALAAKNYRRAEEKARRAIRWMPWAGEPWQVRGDAQFELGDRAAAVRSLRIAVRRDPGDWSMWYDLGIAARGSESARALARAAIENPRDPNVVALCQRRVIAARYCGGRA